LRGFEKVLSLPTPELPFGENVAAVLVTPESAPGACFETSPQ
jgi:hypothetical protein